MRIALDPNAPYRSCRSIERELYVFHDGARFCCVPPRGDRTAPRVEEYVAGPLDRTAVETARRKLREANNGGGRARCDGCPHLAYESWHRQQDRSLVRALGVSSSLPCNLKCDYCSQVRLLARSRELNRVGAYLPLLHRALGEGWLGADGRVTLGGGEPVLVPDFEECLRALVAHGLRVAVLTNATVFSPALHAALAASVMVSVLTSIDCGTPELYARMKGKDLFACALENLGHYARTGGDVTAKYIISSNNTDDREFAGFARQLEHEGIRRAAIAINTDPATPFPTAGPHSPSRAAARLQTVLWRHGLDVKVMDFGLKERGVLMPARAERAKRPWYRLSSRH